MMTSWINKQDEPIREGDRRSERVAVEARDNEDDVKGESELESH